MPSQNNGGHVEEASTWKEGDPDIFDGEEHGGAVDELNLDHDDAAWPSGESNPVNGEKSEDIQNDATPHDYNESENELENTNGAHPHDEEAEFNTADDAEAKEAADDVYDDVLAGDDSTAAADVEIEEKPSEGHTEGILHDAEPDAEPSDEHTEGIPRDSEPSERSDEVLNAERDTDEVDAPSPMDVDVPQPPDTGTAASDADGDGAMEVEYPTGDEVTGESTSDQLVTDSIGKENNEESPMAEDNVSSQPFNHRTATEVSELPESENVISQTAAADEAEYDEVDASQSKTDDQGDVSDISQNVESGNVEGLVEGDDYTVELQPDTSEQESAVSEVDQSATESDSAEKTGIELASGAAEESDKTTDESKPAATDADTSSASASDTVSI